MNLCVSKANIDNNSQVFGLHSYIILFMHLQFQKKQFKSIIVKKSILHLFDNKLYTLHICYTFVNTNKFLTTSQ
jgi:hypothetical protein